MANISIKNEDVIFIYRVAGILRNNNKVLFQVEDGGYLIPGGRVEFNESSIDGIIREFKEELGIEVSIKRLLAVGENFMNYEDCKIHNLAFYYELDSSNLDLISNESFSCLDEVNNKLDFKWVSLEELKGIDIYPTNLKDIILTNSQEIQHFVYTEGY